MTNIAAIAVISVVAIIAVIAAIAIIAIIGTSVDAGNVVLCTESAGGALFVYSTTFPAFKFREYAGAGG